MNAVQELQKQQATKRLAGKVALVTGGARGIGAAIALRLAAEGATVALTYAKNKNAADEVASQIEAGGGKAVALKSDASSQLATQKLAQELKDNFGKIDIVVNNAGVFEATPLGELTLDQYERIFDVNVKGVVATTIAALPLINEGGRIINISSVVATKTFAGASIYSASKAALSTLTRVWAQDLGARKITVNSVAPGATVSDMYNAALPDNVKDELPGKTALGRHGYPDDIAKVVAFIASSESEWVTGQHIEVDGGAMF